MFFMKLHKILIVDDDIDTLNSIESCFEETESKYLFYRANNGLGALQIALEVTPDLIITEWEIPVMNGMGLIRKIRTNENTAQIPIIVLTSKVITSEHLQTVFNTGDADYIRKPINKIELISRVRFMLMLSDSFKKIVELKNRELTNMTIQLLCNKEFNTKLQQKVISINNSFGALDSQLRLQLFEIKDEISEKLKGEAWSQFDMYLKMIHPNFFSRLTLVCPTISSSELRLAAFLRLNIATKDIASILFITVDSARTARTRLRKKLNITRDDKLATYLLSI